MIRSPAFRLKKHSETQIVAKIAKSGKSNREWEQGYSDTLLGDSFLYFPYFLEYTLTFFTTGRIKGRIKGGQVSFPSAS